MVVGINATTRPPGATSFRFFTTKRSATSPYSERSPPHGGGAVIAAYRPVATFPHGGLVTITSGASVGFQPR